MKLLETARKTATKAVAAVVRVVAGGDVEGKARDPWYGDDERKAEINARGRKGRRRWLGPPRKSWLRRTR